ncbi:MAG: FAD-dependent oxidoreductase [Hyphomicrobiaceae bacterium]|nr:FAD-dependent oxidoreductase [Hyphomicrobiaceae bacterium]
MSAEQTLPSHAEAVVIGGGAMGCSVLYHLAKLGVKDAILLERSQLTSGTTWHSAAQVRQLRSTQNLTRLIQYSAKLYADLEGETGQQTGWYQTGSLSIATNPDRLTHIRRQAALAKAYGVAAEEIGVDDLRRHWPLANLDDVIGAIWSPDDGRVNPSDFCQALVKGAKANGARIFENTAVTGFLKSGNRVVGVKTKEGDVRADRVVICGGLWSRELSQMAGTKAPLLPCEHFYLLTKPVAGIDGHLPTLSDHDSHLYIRDEVGGLLVGCFEPMGKPIDPATLGESFAFGLLNEDWDHFEPMMLNALHRLPVLESAEVRMLLNGPESFTPDGSFLLGQAPEVDGLWLCCGMNSVGIATGGGAGWALAQWMVEGAPPFALDEVNPARFPEVQNQLDFLIARAPEVLGEHYAIAYPGHQWKTGRNLRKMPLHDKWVEAGARFAQVYGWERPQYFNSTHEPDLTFGRPEWFEQVGVEVEAAHKRAAIFDQSTFGKIRVRGADAEGFLNRVCANEMSRPPGSVIYTGMLNARGGYESDFTILRLGPDDYRLYVGTAAVRRDLAWLRRHLRGSEDVETLDETEKFAVLGLMGPETARIVAELGAVEMADLGYFQHGAFILAGVEVRAARISYVGEYGFELTCAAKSATRLYDALAGAGACPAGLFAQTSMRIEKRFLAMGHDLDSDVTPLDAGLGFAVKKRGTFVGSDALEQQRDDGVSQSLLTILVDNPEANPLGDEPVYADGILVGQVTSAAFGYRVGKPVALAHIDLDAIPQPEGARVALDIAGVQATGTITLRAAFDPDGMRMRRHKALAVVA